MTRKCDVTGKRSQVAGGYSNRTRATQFNPTGSRMQKVNIQKKKLYVPELGKHVRVELSTKALKTIQKKGAYAVLKDAGLIDNLS